MSLYTRMYDAIQEGEDFIEMATSTEALADDVAQQFVDWYNVHSSHQWAREMSTAEIYEQFKLTL